MKILFIALALVTFSTLSIADEPQKPFTDMTYVELQQVDKESLSKAEKKTYKKAYKAAQKAQKKAEKARIKAERKAEKARKKEEKALLKAQRKREKAIKKKMKSVNRFYAKTRRVDDEFSANIQVRGPKVFVETSFLKALNGPVPKYALVSLIDPQTHEHSLNLYVSTSKTEYEVNISYLKAFAISLDEYAEQNGIWSHFSRAVLRGGVRRNVLLAQKYADPCSPVVCTFTEDYIVELQTVDLESALAQKTTLAIKMTSDKRIDPIVVYIPYDYLVGYGLKLADVSPSLAEIDRLAQNGRSFIMDGR
ncbi:MAG: hypothetical protein JKY34_07695 [Kordiimonadaceae bacterium]|nr:hypothetical protein [Kordiimonadaceae bacterium]